MPGIVAVGDEMLKLGLHRLVKLLGLRVDGYHARSVADAQDLLARQLPVDISCEGSEIADAAHI